MLSTVGTNRRGPRIVVDCEDSNRGRGLLLVSALHLAAPGLRNVELTAISAGHQNVETALEVLVWESGLAVTRWDGPPEAALQDARLFVAIAVTDTRHLPMDVVAARGIPCLVPVQFPRDGDPIGTFALERVAHDPRRLANLIIERLGP